MGKNAKSFMKKSIDQMQKNVKLPVICQFLMCLVIGLSLSSCVRSGVVVSERSDSISRANLYVQTRGTEPTAFEVYSDRQLYGLGRAVDTMDSQPVPWAVLGGDSFRATANGFSESVNPNLVVTGITVNENALPKLEGRIKGTTRGLPIEDILKEFQRQIEDPVLVVFLGVVTTEDIYNNNQFDDFQDALIQVVVAPQDGKLKDGLDGFFPQRERKFSDDPIYNGVLIPLTDLYALELRNPETMRLAVKTVENLRADTRLKECDFVAYDLADIEQY